jgi:ABC-type sugar transport system ATPase subunit
VEACAIQMNNICKSYFNVNVLKNASVCFNAGEIHAIVGSNGAGKSTLVKILAGVIPMDSGEIYMNGQLLKSYDSFDAIRLGIGIADQDVHLFPQMRVYENIVVGKEHEVYGKNRFFLPGHKNMIKEAQHLLDRLGSSIDPMRRVSTLSLAERQIIQFLHTVVAKPKVLIVDEVTAGLNSLECWKVFNVLNQMKANGCCVIYISHQLSDIIPICDKVTVLRDGEVVGTYDAKQMPREELVTLMLGRSLNEQYPKLPVKQGRRLLRVRNVATHFLRDISFDLHEGEILGIAGLLGSGRTSLTLSIIGQQPIQSGEIEVMEEAMPTRTRQTFGIVPDNRDEFGLYSRMSVASNITISNLKKVLHKHLISEHEEQLHTRDLMDRLGIQGASYDQPVQYLSGGNKQKTVVARCIYSNARIFIFDEPTKGVDTAGKVEIYNIMNELVKRGCAIILVTSDFSELVGMCDHVIVLNKGRQVFECDRSKTTKALLYSYVNFTSNPEPS